MVIVILRTIPALTSPYRIDLDSGDQTVLSSHEMGANAIVHDSHHNLLISASWDKTLHIHHTSNPTIEPATLTLPAKPFKLAISSTKLVVAMANRLIHIYDLAAIAMISSQSSQPAPNPIDLEPLQIRESSLKFMTKAVASMPSGEGYASSSIEGRVAVEWFDASEESQNRKYAFKCHRQAAPIDPNADPEDAESNVDIVYPVNALAFHPTFGTFVSGGGDAVVAVWDAVAKRRIRQFAKYADGIAALAFSPDGQWLAVATSPQFEEDSEFEPEKGAVQIAIRQATEKEFNARK